VKKKLIILSIVMVVIGALGIEVQERSLSSPAPVPQLGRTAATFGRNGETVFVAPHIRVLFIAWFVLTLGVLAASVCWPTKKGNDVAA
jgi:hypothetical protein